VERLYQRHAPFYDLTRRFVLPGRQLAIDALGVQRGDSVIDFACGTGLNVPGLLRAGAGRVIGVDVSPAMLLRAARRFPGIELVRGDLAAIDLGVQAPRVLCSWGLSLVDDPAGSLANLARHVAPGGTLVLLDFDRLSGPWALLQPPLSAWLSLFGVRSPFRKLRDDWPPELEEAGGRSIAGGYGALVQARKRHPGAALA
jgi:ubiquinone/menaquinone biosynthesis C-methylase UbiE